MTSPPVADAIDEPPASSGRGILSECDWESLRASLGLSNRELQILACVFDDETEAQMGLRLGISSHTVHTYLVRLYRKLDVSSRCELLICVFARHLTLLRQTSSTLDVASRVT